MAQAGFTPIQLYFSTTASATPSAGNLANGELAINITDGRLFYKDNGGTVRVLAGTGGSGVVAGSNTQVQFNNNGVFGASANMTFNGTRLSVADFADASLTAGRVTYAGAGGNLTDSANLTFDGTTLTANALTVSNAVTLSGGTANGVAYLNGSKVVTTGSALQFNGTILGVGATPTAWGGSGVRAIDIGSGGAVSGSGADVGLVANSYYDGNNWIYKTSSLSARYQQIIGSGTHLWFSAPAGTAGGVVSYEQLMQLTLPASNQATLTIGQGLGGSTQRNTIVMANGGFSDQPGNQNTGSNGDKMVLYSGFNRSAMGIGNDYNWWSQSKSFEWWISPNNLSTTVTKQLTLTQTGLDFGVSNDSVPRRISVNYSTVPMYMSNSFDGTSGLSTISNNIWNTSNGSTTWSAFNNVGYGAAAIQLVSNTSGAYILMGATSAANVTPTGSLRLNKYGISSGSSSYPEIMGGTLFPHYLSNANLFADGGTNRVLALDSSASSGSMWLGLGGVQKYANDWDNTAWRRWVNVSSTWFNTHNLLPESGLEREEYNPGFLYQVAQGTSYTNAGNWSKIFYNVSGGSRSLARDGNGYDASGRFTAPASGWYHFAAQVSFSSSNDIDGTIKFILNGNSACYGPSSSQTGGSQFPGSRQLSGTMYLTEGDYIEVWCYFSGSTNVVRGSQPYSGSFSGHFVG